MGSVVRAISSSQLVHRDKSHIDELLDIEPESRLQTIIDIVVVFAILECERITYLSPTHILCPYRVDTDAHMIEECRELHEESSLVPESTLDVKNDTRVLTIIAPLGEHTAFELYF
jgi:hypothetical protein